MNMSSTSTLIDVNSLTNLVLDSYNEAHNMMADLANRLYDLLIAAKGGDQHDHAITESIDMLINHTALQFEYEDGEMRGADFPATAQHIEAHRETLNSLAQARMEWLRVGDTDTLDHYLTEVLTPWMISHIDKMDSVAAMYIAAGRSANEEGQQTDGVSEDNEPGSRQ